MIVEVSNELKVSNLTFDEKRELKESLSFINPKWTEAVRFGRRTYGIQKIIRQYRCEGSTLIIPRGCLHSLIEKFGPPEKLIDNRISFDKVDIPSKIELRSLQKPWVENALKHNQGICVAAAGMGKCVSYNSYLFTEEGFLELSEIVPKTSISDIFIPKKMAVADMGTISSTSHLYLGGLSDTVEIKSKFGYGIEGTPEHKVVTLSQEGSLIWKCLGDIKLQDTLVINTNSPIWPKDNITWVPDYSNRKLIKYKVGPIEIDPQIAWCLGLITAEGSLLYKDHVRISNGNKDIVSDLEECISNIGLKLIKKRGENVDYVVHSTIFREFLLWVGMDYVKSNKKTIPEQIRRSPKKIISSYIRGLFDGDGHCSKKLNYIEITLASKKLIFQLQQLLLGFGILSSIKIKYNRKYKKYYYRLNIFDLEKFQREIGFSCPYKQKALKLGLSRKNAVKTNTNVDLFPVKELLCQIYAEARQHHSWDYQEYRKKPLFKDYVYKKSKKSPSRSKVKEIINTYKHVPSINKLKELYNLDTVFLPIIKIVKSKNMVADLSVPKTHSFVSNGVCCHNTVCSLEMISRLGQPVLWLVDQTDLAEQFMEKAEEFVDIGQVGLIGNGEESLGKIATAGLIQTLHKRDLSDIVSLFGAVFVDECHTVPATTVTKVVSQFPSKRLYGLTATPYREDNLEILMYNAIGPTITYVDRDELVETGLILPASIKACNTGVTYNKWGKPEYRDVIDYLSTHEARNSMIVLDILSEIAVGNVCIALTLTIEHGKLLRQRLLGVGVDCEHIHSKQYKKTRKEKLKRFKSGEIPLMIATHKLLGKGFDHPPANRLFYTLPQKAENATEQSKGRIERVTEGKADAVVYDYLDDIEMLKRQFEIRMLKYNEHNLKISYRSSPT